MDGRVIDPGIVGLRAGAAYSCRPQGAPIERARLEVRFTDHPDVLLLEHGGGWVGTSCTWLRARLDGGGLTIQVGEAMPGAIRSGVLTELLPDEPEYVLPDPTSLPPLWRLVDLYCDVP